MKKIVSIGCLVFPLIVFTQNANGMDQTQLMQKYQALQACMANVNHAELKALGAHAKQLGAEIKVLCANGNKAGALAKVKRFAQEAQANSVVQSAKKCSEELPQMMPKILAYLLDNPDKIQSDVCEISRNYL